MKHILFIGDIHGVPDWQELMPFGLYQCDEIVFLGDYIDSFHISPEDQLSNLQNIIEFAKKESDVVTLLLGNHDYALIHGYSSISGYQHGYASAYKELFENNKDLFSIAWGYTNEKGKYTLATHAGLQWKYWQNYVLREFEKDKFLYKLTDGKNDLPIHETLNFLKDKKDTIWTVGPRRGGFQTGSPIWADYNELITDPYPNINQIVGHTPGITTRITSIEDGFLACIDLRGNIKIASMTISL